MNSQLYEDWEVFEFIFVSCNDQGTSNLRYVHYYYNTIDCDYMHAQFHTTTVDSQNYGSVSLKLASYPGHPMFFNVALHRAQH